jgi:hypothetical protein
MMLRHFFAFAFAFATVTPFVFFAQLLDGTAAAPANVFSEPSMAGSASRTGAGGATNHSTRAVAVPPGIAVTTVSASDLKTHWQNLRNRLQSSRVCLYIYMCEGHLTFNPANQQVVFLLKTAGS